MWFKTLAVMVSIAGGLLGGGLLTPGVTGQAAAKAVWQRPSERKPYPNLHKYRHAYLYVNTKTQRVTVYSRPGTTKRVLYRMLCSTGVRGNATPKGTYHIQRERGRSFYNASVRVGANDWVSWKGHGTYLFHSVPVTKRGHYIRSEAAKLGKKKASHGCVRLSVADANWVYTHVPYGMKVVIR